MAHVVKSLSSDSLLRNEMLSSSVTAPAADAHTVRPPGIRGIHAYGFALPPIAGIAQIVLISLAWRSFT